MTIEKLVDVVRGYAESLSQRGLYDRYDYIPCEYFDVFTKRLAPSERWWTQQAYSRNCAMKNQRTSFDCMRNADIMPAPAARHAGGRQTRPEEAQVAVSDYVNKALGGDGWHRNYRQLGQRCAPF